MLLSISLSLLMRYEYFPFQRRTLRQVKQLVQRHIVNYQALGAGVCPEGWWRLHFERERIPVLRRRV